MPKTNDIPTYDQLMNPLLSALRKLGGSASIDEMYEEVVEEQGFSEEALAVLQNPEKTNQTKIGYRLAWARTYLKKVGYLENSARGVWAITEKARSVDSIDPKAVVSQVRQNDELSQRDSKDDFERVVDSEKPDEVLVWRERLHKLLIDEMSPDAFERLTQRMLRESGFIHVEVTGRTGDGGIDGKGIARINGLMSFHIAFQCKKYKGSVGAPEIRDFRGATVGRADRGLFITTGSFTKAAIEEANRDGVAPIDLIDGDQLADKLKELSLGVKTELVEKVSVVDDWFLSL
jgi:restriction system protein